MRAVWLFIAVFLSSTSLALGDSMPGELTDAQRSIGSIFGGGGDPLTSHFLHQIFGPLFTSQSPGTATNSIFPILIGLFNVFVLALGGILFAYNAIAGVLQSAHEGEVLGRRWSTLWAPLRVLVAVAMLLPVPGMHGYNTIQAAVAYIVEGSTQAASILWGEVAERIFLQQLPVTGASPAPNTELLHAAFTMQLCRAVAEHTMSGIRLESANGEMTGSQFRASLAGMPDHSGGGNLSWEGWSYPSQYFDPLQPQVVTEGWVRDTAMRIGMPGYTSRRDVDIEVAEDLPAITYLTIVRNGTPQRTINAGSLNNFEICGRIETPSVPRGITQSGSRQLQEAFLGRHSQLIQRALDLTAWPAYYTVRQQLAGETLETHVLAQIMFDALMAIDRQHRQHIGALAVLRREAEDVNEETMQERRARQMLARYIQGGNLNPACSGDGQRQEGCEQTEFGGQGWLGAGTWYMHVARLNSENHQIADAQPVVTGMPSFNARITAERGLDNSVFGGWLGYSHSEEDRGNIRSIEGDSARIYNNGQRAWESAASALGAFATEFDRDLASQLARTNDTGMFSAARNTLDAHRFVAELSEYFSPRNWDADPMVGLSAMGQTMVEIGSALAAGAGLAGVAENWTGGSVSSFMMTIATPLIIAGSILAFILPLMPFLLWVLAVTGYFLLVAEALVAVNLWAIAHMRLDGEGIAGEAGRQGYYLILALALTPILMIFGFILGMSIFKVTTLLINMGMFAVIQGMYTQAGVQWVAGMFVIAIMMVLVYVVVIERSFSLITQFPTSVLRWLGTDAPISRGEEDRMRMAALGASATAAQTTSGVTKSGLTGLGVGGIRGPGVIQRAWHRGTKTNTVRNND